MAGPAILGLPWLASVLGSTLLSVVSWLTTYVSRRVAILVAVLAAVGTLTAGFLALIHGAIAAFSYAMPSAPAIGMVVPSEAPTMLSVYFAMKTAQWVYHWNVAMVQLRLF